MKLEALKLTKSFDEEQDLLAEHIKAKYLNTPLQILEAGCGHYWGLNLDGIEFYLTGVDLDAKSLNMRIETLKDLHESIVGDLVSITLPNNYYDVIFNSFVLEHVKDAEKVMSNFVRWLKPGGIIVLKIPDPNSSYGFITRFSPHWFHVFFYRYLLGLKEAGTLGRGPYKTFYSAIVSRAGIYDFCKKNGLHIVLERGDGWSRPGAGMKLKIIHVAKIMISLFSFGKLSHEHTNLIYVIEKR